MHRNPAKHLENMHFQLHSKEFAKCSPLFVLKLISILILARDRADAAKPNRAKPFSP